MEQDTVSALIPKIEDYSKPNFELNYIHTEDLELPPIHIDEFGQLEDKSFYISDSELTKIKEEAVIDSTFEFLSSACHIETDDVLQPGSSQLIQQLKENGRRANKIKGKHIYYCPICKKKFLTLPLRKAHLVKHFGRNLVTCHHCGQMFTRQISYLVHYSRHFVKKKKLQFFKCDMCSKTLRSKFQLAEHIMFSHFMDDENGKASKFVANTVPLYKCKLCMKPFRFKYELDRHYRGLTCIDKSDGMKYTCQQCPKSFENPEALSVHISNHPPEIKEPKKRPFKCEYCLMFYSKKEKWQEHILQHITSIEPVLNQCEVCQVQFKKKEIFDNHVSVNTVQEPYQCPTCMQSFNLKCHQFTICAKSTPPAPIIYETVVCNICDKQFVSEYNLERHIHKIHGSILTSILISKQPPKHKRLKKIQSK